MPTFLENCGEKRALVFGATTDLSFALGAMIVGFLKHNTRYDGHIIILHDGISTEQQSVFRCLFKNTSFRTFSESYVRRQLGDDNDAPFVNRFITAYSHFYFAKFELFNLLNEFDRVIWMDADMLVRGPLDDLWNFDEFCWRETFQKKIQRRTDMYTLFSSHIKDLRMAHRTVA